jgi:uncharacterized protein YcaQ
VRFVNCIQYDPINVVGQNPHLVLQSRVRNYKPAILDQLLYKDRNLVDGFDKVMSIYPIEDWPFFADYRAHIGQRYRANESKKITRLIDWVTKEIEERGPLSSLDLEEETRVQSWFGNPARASRIALDILFFSGELVVHHRVGTRRYFELAQRVLAKKLHGAPDPHISREAYFDWHVERRVGSLGLARTRNSGQWGGIQRAKGVNLNTALARLVGRGELLRVGIEELPGQVLYVRESDGPALQAAARPRRAAARAAFIAPLDNFIWDRDLIEDLFDFYYRWEVYVPGPKRNYGYYVLPVLYGEQLVARLDPAYDRATRTFIINNWWWQKGAKRKDAAMLAALQDCMLAFANYLGAEKIELGAKLAKESGLKAAARRASQAIR